jgi:hypothetical protein
MIGWFLGILIVILVYLTRSREGFIGLTDSTPMKPMIEFIQHDLDTLNGKRLLYVIYKNVANTALIDKKIKEVKMDDQYSTLRIFPVTNTVVATSLFYNFYRNQIDYDEITVLTNNVNTTKKDNTQLTVFVNTDTPWFQETVSIITANNIVE